LNDDGLWSKVENDFRELRTLGETGVAPDKIVDIGL
jgi:hypothetical protein